MACVEIMPTTLVTCYSLRIQKNSRLPLHAVLDEALCPRPVEVVESHLRHDVDEHPEGKELDDPLPGHALALDELDEPAEPRAFSKIRDGRAVTTALAEGLLLFKSDKN